MADEKIGYVYLNSVNRKGYDIRNDLDQATARYKVSDPDNLIIYIEDGMSIKEVVSQINIL